MTRSAMAGFLTLVEIDGVAHTRLLVGLDFGIPAVNRECIRIDAHEAKAIEAALNHKREEEARNELRDLRTRLLKMESRLAASAADVDRLKADRVRPRFR